MIRLGALFFVTLVLVAALATMSAATGSGQASWSNPQPLPGKLSLLQADIACPSARFCVGSGLDFSHAQTFSALASLGRAGKAGSGDPPSFVLSKSPSVGASWRFDERSDTGSWENFDCASVTLCVASKEEGAGATLYASRNPERGVHSFKQVAATENVQSGSGPVVSCPTTNFCAEIISDDEGATHLVRISRQPTIRGSWRRRSFPPPGAEGNRDSAMACGSRQLCIAYATGGDTDDVAVLRNPVDLRSRWSTSDANPTAGDVGYYSREQFTAATCVGTSCMLTTNYGAVVTAGQVESRGTKWTRTQVYGQTPTKLHYYISDPVCFSTTLCYALAPGSNLVVSTTPFSATPSWQTIEVPNVRQAVELSCPSSHLCFVFGEAGPRGEATTVSTGHLNLG